MTQQQNAALNRTLPRRATLVSLTVLATMLTVASIAHSQTFTVLHNFTNGSDGGEPQVGLTMDRAGNFYGTTSTGGNTTGNCAIQHPFGCGTVFKLSRKGSGWILSTLYTFSGPDGANPHGRVIIGPDGTLYGTTPNGGEFGYGTVFNLRPPAAICKSAQCPWTETVLVSFGGFTDGRQPTFGDLVFDGDGNIYGTTPYGGQGNRGTVYELTGPTAAGPKTLFTASSPVLTAFDHTRA